MPKTEQDSTIYYQCFNFLAFQPCPRLKPLRKNPLVPQNSAARGDTNHIKRINAIEHVGI
jgi:hypothetical protein